MASEEGYADAWANCLLVVENVIVLHKQGIPARQLKPDEKPHSKRMRMKKTTTGYNVDAKSKCSERLQKIAEFVKRNKLIAKDVLGGGCEVNDLCRAPDAFFKRKKSNFKINNTRGVDLSEAARERKEAKAKATGSRQSADDETAASEGFSPTDNPGDGIDPVSNPAASKSAIQNPNKRKADETKEDEDILEAAKPPARKRNKGNRDGNIRTLSKQ